jgi:gluconolactonase
LADSMRPMTGSNQLAELLSPDAELERLATGFTFTEGPIYNHDGRHLLFSDMPADVRRSWSEADGVVEVARPANKCNGMVYDADGNLLVCEHSTSTLVRERPDGTRETIASHFEGKELNSPNDVCMRSDGTIYFSDPPYGRTAAFGVEREQELDFQAVFAIRPDGELQLAVARDEFEGPNGLCFSPDESILYVNDSPRMHIKAYDVAADGSLSGVRVHFQVPAGEPGEGMPDGMKCDAQGNIWVTGPRGVWIISPAGEHLGVIEVPEVVGNLAWGGDDWRTLFLPSSTSLYRIATLVGPAPLPYH